MTASNRRRIQTLSETHRLPPEELRLLLAALTPEEEAFLFREACRVRERVYGKTVYLRGLIEFSNYCRNNCYYCGLRRGNLRADRYRLTKEEILACARAGYACGLRTIVLQSGEDAYFSTMYMKELITAIKEALPDCAVTLSVGEKSRATYAAYFSAGADRYLLRHETASASHYQKLHPQEMSYANRLRCLRDLKAIGFQTGMGMMVGAPFQTLEELLLDLKLLQDFQPHMAGIGPFIPHADTPFAQEKVGDLHLSLRLLALTRLLLPKVLLPATTALGSIHPMGREMGLLAGANVGMPNISPLQARRKYRLYDHKADVSAQDYKADAAAQETKEVEAAVAVSVRAWETRVKRAGLKAAPARGDYPLEIQ